MTKRLKIICMLLTATMFCAQFIVAEDVIKNQENNSAQMLKIDNFRVIEGNALKTTIKGEDIFVVLDDADCQLWDMRKFICAYDNESFVSLEQANFITTYSRFVLTNILNKYRGNIRFLPIHTEKTTEELAVIGGVLYAGGININEYMIKEGKCLRFEKARKKYDLPITKPVSLRFDSSKKNKEEIDKCVQRSFHKR